MAASQTSESSSNETNTQTNNNETTVINSKFPLIIVVEKNKTKLKWTGDVETLKSFVECQLLLEGAWTFTTNNGGFHIFKASIVTLCFYPGTKTLVVQGAKKEKIEKKIESFASNENNVHVVDIEEETFGGHEYNAVSDNNNNNNNADDDEPLANDDTQRQSCLKCEENSDSILDLRAKFTTLESQFTFFTQNQSKANPTTADHVCQSCETLTAKISELEAERNLLLRLLEAKDVRKSSNNERHSRNAENTTRKINQSQQHGAQHPKSKTMQNNASQFEHEKSKKAPTQPSYRGSNREKDANGSKGNDQAKPVVAIIGDSMTKLINGRKLSRSSRVISKSFPGATIEDMEHYSKPVLSKKPGKVIIHTGTNNIRNDSPNQVKKKMVSLVSSIKQDHPDVEVAISSLIKRNDGRNPNEKKAQNDKINEINTLLERYCHQNNIDFISNDNVHENCLNAGGLHLNLKGVHVLASNFRTYINY